MERIVYRKTLDVHKNGIQFTLQGFETADNVSRRIELSLMASGDTIDLPLEQLEAIIYVTTPNSTEPSINECTIKDNTIIYDVLPIVEEGITEMQLKLIGTGPDGADGVLMSPRFAVEVSLSNSDDGSAKQTTTYTALEDAIAKANGVYDARLLRIELDDNCIFRAVYADGTIYETDVLYETVLKGEAILSQSYARGGTGIRTGEDTDNSMYYSKVSKSESLQSSKAREETEELLEEVKKHSIHTVFSIDFETGTIKYESQQYSFDVNEETGDLDIIGDSYTPSADVEQIVRNWLATLKTGFEERVTSLENGKEFLNVKDFGAKGDGETDDYEAISNLLTTYPKANLYFPSGTYLISSTLDISNKKILRGSGGTTIKYTGEDLLLNITGDYLNKPTIERLNFTSTANTLLVSCKRANNSWGGSFVMRDCKIVGFNHTIMRFNSAYHVELNNLIIQSNGMFLFTTPDGTTTESNFSNSINFTNVHHSLLDKNTKPSILFDIQNVRQIMFYNCQFHDCTTLMQGTTAKEIHFINTWFERIENIYKFDSASDKPKMTNCRYVEMKKFNGNSVVIDENRGEKHIEIFATENEYTPNLLNDSNEEILFSQVEIFNAKDTYAKYFYPYKFTSKGGEINIPFNCVKVSENSIDTISYVLKNIIRYSKLYCDFEIIGICDYSDNTKTIVRQKVISAKSHSNPSTYGFYANSVETVFQSASGEAKANPLTLATSVDGVVSLSQSLITSNLTLLIRFNILGGI